MCIRDRDGGVNGERFKGVGRFLKKSSCPFIFLLGSLGISGNVSTYSTSGDKVIVESVGVVRDNLVLIFLNPFPVTSFKNFEDEDGVFLSPLGGVCVFFGLSTKGVLSCIILAASFYHHLSVPYCKIGLDLHLVD